VLDSDVTIYKIREEVCSGVKRKLKKRMTAIKSEEQGKKN
jgi:hypothetical protein